MNSDLISILLTFCIVGASASGFFFGRLVYKTEYYVGGRK